MLLFIIQTKEVDADNEQGQKLKQTQKGSVWLNTLIAQERKPFDQNISFVMYCCGDNKTPCHMKSDITVLRSLEQCPKLVYKYERVRVRLWPTDGYVSTSKVRLNYTWTDEGLRDNSRRCLRNSKL